MLKLDHIALNVPDLNRSCEFYLSLGAKKVSKPSLKFVEIIWGGVRIHIVQEDNLQNVKPPCGLEHFCLEVDTFDNLKKIRDQFNSHPMLAHLSPFEIQESPPMGMDGKGHVEERPPWQVLYAKDPDDTMIEFRLYK